MIPKSDDHSSTSSSPNMPKKSKKKHFHALISKISKKKKHSPENPIPTSQPISNLHIHHYQNHTCLGILRQSLILPSKNVILILSAVLVNIIASCLILLFYYFSVNSVIIDLTMKLKSLRTIDPLDPLYPLIIAAILKDVGELTSIEIAFVIISIAIAPFVKTVTIYALSVTHCNVRLTFLELFFKALLSLIRSIATQVLVALLFLAYLAVVGGILYLLLQVSHWSSLGIAASAVVVALAAPPFVYLVIICAMSVMVAAIEEGYFWTGALFRAMEVVRGRRMLGVLIIIPAIVLVAAAALAHALIHRNSNLDVGMQMAEGYVYIFVSELLNLFILAAVTIYYHECKSLRDQEALTDMYARLPSGDEDGDNRIVHP